MDHSHHHAPKGAGAVQFECCGFNLSHCAHGVVLRDRILSPSTDKSDMQMLAVRHDVIPAIIMAFSVFPLSSCWLVSPTVVPTAREFGNAVSSRRYTVTFLSIIKRI